VGWEYVGRVFPHLFLALHPWWHHSLSIHVIGRFFPWNHCCMHRMRMLEHRAFPGQENIVKRWPLRSQKTVGDHWHNPQQRCFVARFTRKTTSLVQVKKSSACLTDYLFNHLIRKACNGAHAKYQGCNQRIFSEWGGNDFDLYYFFVQQLSMILISSLVMSY